MDYDSPLPPLLPVEWLSEPAGQITVLVATVLLVIAHYLAKLIPEPKAETTDKTSRFHAWPHQWAALWLLMLLLAAATGVASLLGFEAGPLRGLTLLFAKWTAISLVCRLIRDNFWYLNAVVVLFALSTLYALNIHLDTYQLLNALRIDLGKITITAWGALAGLFVISVALWLSMTLAQFVESRINKVERFTASTKVLVGKTLRVFLIALAIAIALQSIGIDLTVLTVLGGAIGLGIGFGLQKIVANLISGFILLTDRSIKPGDVIEIDNTYGWINNLRARYVSVITRDGKEHLIPNEDLITCKVVNWSFSDSNVRIKATIGVSYKSDVHQAIKLCCEAALMESRVLRNPGPVCLLTGFGDSSVNLELRFWIKDPAHGVANIRSAVLLHVWDLFAKHGIEIPYPQRDLHLRSGFPPPDEVLPQTPLPPADR